MPDYSVVKKMEAHKEIADFGITKPRFTFEKNRLINLSSLETPISVSLESLFGAVCVLSLGGFACNRIICAS